MRRALLTLALLAGGCTPAHIKPAKQVGKWMSLGGVVGLMAAAGASYATDGAHPFLVTFQVISAAGLITYAAAELSEPQTKWKEETVQARHTRWAKILAERAAGAARDGRCPRVRRLEVRIRRYDPVVHDFVLLRDPEILKCLHPSETQTGTDPGGPSEIRTGTDPVRPVRNPDEPEPEPEGASPAPDGPAAEVPPASPE